MRPLRELQETRVATREESAVLGFPSRRGLTPRGSLECNPEIPALTNTLSLTGDQWLKLTNGQHTLTIKATDAKDASAVRTLTFTKAVTSVEFVQTVAMTADAMPTKALVNIQGNFPAGCTLQVWICNNGNDASPTWEDITTKALNSQKHFFTNTTKTASDWGVKVKVKLLRGSATETCYIQSIGGNFA